MIGENTLLRRRFCKQLELIENYEEAVNSPERWVCHHRLETHTSDGERRLVDLTQEELEALGMYWHRPPEELIFLTYRDHNSLHRKGKRLSDTTKARIGARCRERCKDPEYLRKMSECHTGIKHSEETKQRISEIVKGKKWFNNGKVCVRRLECPDGFVPGRLRRSK